jgi:hypothetical protein
VVSTVPTHRCWWHGQPAGGPPGEDRYYHRAADCELKTGLGLDHFEGRSFTGWHRHVTRAILAQAFCTLLRADPKAPSPG